MNLGLASLVAQTIDRGEFWFGPIDASFTAVIIVIVKDDSGNRLLGLLLSLSGVESSRMNLMIGTLYFFYCYLIKHFLFEKLIN